MQLLTLFFTKGCGDARDAVLALLGSVARSPVAATVRRRCVCNFGLFPLGKKKNRFVCFFHKRICSVVGEGCGCFW